MAIVGALPNTLTNGTTADANQVQANDQFIANQVNANALPLAGGTVTGDVTVTGTVNAQGLLKGKGTTTNDSAAAGYIGEILEATGTAVAMTSGLDGNITQIALQAGDYLAWANISTGPAGTTTTSLIAASISLTSADRGSAPNGGAFLVVRESFSAGLGQGYFVGMRRVSLAAPQTLYLVGRVDFSVSTMTATGYLGVHRIR